MSGEDRPGDDPAARPVALGGELPTVDQAPHGVGADTEQGGGVPDPVDVQCR
ncbi:hypothetical protein OG277_43475 [Streptomyces phaeochromogenes]|nr:hypothetical protein OG277_43475 [Streptomyces phaeochromogenes]